MLSRSFSIEAEIPQSSILTSFFLLLFASDIILPPPANKIQTSPFGLRIYVLKQNAPPCNLTLNCFCNGAVPIILKFTQIKPLTSSLDISEGVITTDTDKTKNAKPRNQPPQVP